MGLGLPFIKRVMDTCGGKIEVESRVGKGTMFQLLVPSAGKRSRRHEKKILLVEDEKALCLLYEEELSGRGTT